MNDRLDLFRAQEKYPKSLALFSFALCQQPNVFFPYANSNTPKNAQNKRQAEKLTGHTRRKKCKAKDDSNAWGRFQISHQTTFTQSQSNTVHRYAPGRTAIFRA